jgi:hypothetical protein
MSQLGPKADLPFLNYGVRPQPYKRTFGQSLGMSAECPITDAGYNLKAIGGSLGWPWFQPSEIA